MNHQTISSDQARAVFADPVGYLSEHGLEAVLVTTTSLAAAA